MTTLVLQLDLDLFALIKSGKRSFYIGKFKQPLQEGQRVIFQTPFEEIDTKISNIHSDPGMIKHYSIISFPAVEQRLSDEAPNLRRASGKCYRSSINF